MNIKLDHTFFPPPLSIAKLDDKVVEEIIAKLNDRLSIERDRYSPYPEEMLKRLSFILTFRWKDLAFQKMVQNEFANHRIRLLEIELDQCRADKLADSKLVEQLLNVDFLLIYRSRRKI